MNYYKKVVFVVVIVLDDVVIAIVVVVVFLCQCFSFVRAVAITSVSLLGGGGGGDAIEGRHKEEERMKAETGSEAARENQFDVDRQKAVQKNVA